MSAALIALALFGCSDDATVCRRLEVPVETFPTRGQCIDRLDGALSSPAARTADAPTVYAQCLSAAQLSALGSGDFDLTHVREVQVARR